MGAQVFEGQRAENLDGASVVVISSAIKPGNPELETARARGLPVVRLGRLVMRPTGSMTLILDRLEKAHRIERRADPGDRRAVRIVLTDAGREIAEQAAAAYDEIQSRLLGEWVMHELKELDQVAFVRFASVYRSFEDVNEFREAIEKLEREPTAEDKKDQISLLPEE